MFFFFSSRRRHTRLQGDWSSDVCSSDLSSDMCGILRRIPHMSDEVTSPVPTRTLVVAVVVAGLVAGSVLLVGCAREKTRAPRGGSGFQDRAPGDRKSTRLNSSHLVISYAVFCFKKKKKIK